jgi:hypothetical protein
MLGITIDGPTNLFGDNQSVVVGATRASSTLKKKHNAIAFHRVRESLAAGFVRFARSGYWFEGTDKRRPCSQDAYVGHPKIAITSPFGTRRTRRFTRYCRITHDLNNYNGPYIFNKKPRVPNKSQPAIGIAWNQNS